MPSFFSKLKGKDGPTKPSKSSKKSAAQDAAEKAPAKPIWEDAWLRRTVAPEEVQELLKGCTMELKSRGMFEHQMVALIVAFISYTHIIVTLANPSPAVGLDMPFMLLPFRPTSDPSAARSFIRSFFERGQAMHGEHLKQELRLTEPMVRYHISGNI